VPDDIERFIAEYVSDLREGTASVFAGAGLSAAAGFVNWRELMRPIAAELGLDVEHEPDLIAIAQYHTNHNAGNRSQITRRLLEELSIAASPTASHQILARLPIGVYWTTNYDRLIEKALDAAGRIADVKYSVPQLATTKPRRDTVVYKMHGDIEHAHEAVVIKDDYEKYHLNRGPFLTALAGDLIQRTFLFLGFSFTDPNLDYVLSRVRVAFQTNQRRHYCIFKKRTKYDAESDSEFRRAEVRQRLAIEDLKRFNIKTLLIDDYSQVVSTLERIEHLFRLRTVFVSGSADEYGRWNPATTKEFLRTLSAALVQQGYRIISGFGLGVGDAVITGALEQIYAARTGHVEDFLVMRPFPRANPNAEERAQLWEKYRQEMISGAGICILLLGNKSEGSHIVNASGVRREFEIARQRGLHVLPIGASGYMAAELWNEVMKDFATHYPHSRPGLRPLLETLGESTDNPMTLIDPILMAVDLLSKE